MIFLDRFFFVVSVNVNTILLNELHNSYKKIYCIYFGKPAHYLSPNKIWENVHTGQICCRKTWMNMETDKTQETLSQKYCFDKDF